MLLAVDLSCRLSLDRMFWTVSTRRTNWLGGQICLLLLHLPKSICKTVRPSVYEDLNNLPCSQHQIPFHPALQHMSWLLTAVTHLYTSNFFPHYASICCVFIWAISSPCLTKLCVDESFSFWAFKSLGSHAIVLLWKKNWLSLLSLMKILQLNALIPTKFNPAEHSGITALEHSCKKEGIIWIAPHYYI